MDGFNHCSKIPLYFCSLFCGGKETKRIRAAERDGATKATAPDAQISKIPGPPGECISSAGARQCDADGTAGTQARPIRNADRKLLGEHRDERTAAWWSGVE
jgi:hypothetical protein